MVSEDDAGTPSSLGIRRSLYEIDFRFEAPASMEIHAISAGVKPPSLGVFPLEAHVVAADAATPNRPLRLIGHSMGTTDGLETLTVDYEDGDGVRRVVMSFHHSFVTYQVGLLGRRDLKNSVTYFRNQGTHECARGEFQELSSWTPDLYRALLPEHGLSRFTIGSRTPAAGNSYLRGYSAGSPLVAPYVAAILSGRTWWGLGTLEVPSADFGLDISIGRRVLSASFDGPDLSAGTVEEHWFPRVGIFFADTTSEILTAYRESIAPARVQSDPAPAAAWWGGPIYCSWGDQAYQARFSEGRLDESTGPHYASEAYIEKFLDIAERKKLPIKTVVLDLGWAEGYGDFRPSAARFPNLRDYIDRLHSRGLHVLLWMPMFEATGDLFNPDRPHSDVAAQHPDWVVKDTSGRSLDRFDYTVPAVRDYLCERVRFMLGSAPGQLDADGFKLDFMDRVPEASASAFFDPAWGVGERMTLQILELLYKAAKRIKPDAMIDSSFINPFFQPWQTIIRLNDDVSNAVETYWWRAWAAVQSGVRLIDGDDWWAMERYFIPLTLAKAAWGVPSIYALQYRGVLGTAGTMTGVGGIASGGYPSSIDAGTYRQVRSLLDTYLHAPADASQTVRVEPPLRVASRTYTTGPLQGFLAATTLNHATGLVTYTAESAWAVTTVPATMSVPIPPGYLATRVASVGFDAHETDVPFSATPGLIGIEAGDATLGISHYRIEYSPATSELTRFANSGGCSRSVATQPVE